MSTSIRIHAKICVFIALIMITMAAFFWRTSDFGLYEDDYAVVGSFVNKSSSDIAAYVIKCFKDMPAGRPLAFSFPASVTYLGVSLTGDLVFLYVVGAFFCSINAFMLFILLRGWLSLPAAFIGALVFLLNPADTTKILLTHSLILQPSLFCALLGILFYLRRKKWSYVLAYIFGIVTMLFYESAVLVFIFAPFFVREKNRPLWKWLLIHIIVIGIAIFLLLLLRTHIGEARVGDIADGSKLQFLFKILSAPLIGAFGSLAAMIYGTLKGVRDIFVIETFPIIFFGVALIYWLYKQVLKNESKSFPEKISFIVNGKTFSFDLSFYICFVGFIMIPASYLLSFTHYPPICMTGRLTSVHLAATIAWGVFIAGGVEFLLARIKRRNLRMCAFAFLGIIFIFWSLHAIYLQKGYAAVWKGQKKFWNDVQLLAPDIDENTVLIFDNKIMEGANAVTYGAQWALPIAFDLYIANTKDIKKPIAHRPLSDMVWKKENGKIFFYHDGLPDWGKWYELDPKNTIMFTQNSQNDLQRVYELLVLNNTAPLTFRRKDGIISASASQVVPAEPEYIEIKFKKVQEKSKLMSYSPKGFLYHYLKTGKFDLKNSF